MVCVPAEHSACSWRGRTLHAPPRAEAEALQRKVNRLAGAYKGRSTSLHNLVGSRPRLDRAMSVLQRPAGAGTQEARDGGTSMKKPPQSPVTEAIVSPGAKSFMDTQQLATPQGSAETAGRSFIGGGAGDGDASPADRLSVSSHSSGVQGGEIEAAEWATRRLGGRGTSAEGGDRERPHDGGTRGVARGARESGGSTWRGVSRLARQSAGPLLGGGAGRDSRGELRSLQIPMLQEEGDMGGRDTPGGSGRTGGA